MEDRRIEMDEIVELADKITLTIWYDYLKKEKPFEKENETGEGVYVKEAQEIFNEMVDLIDDTLN